MVSRSESSPSKASVASAGCARVEEEEDSGAGVVRSTSNSR